MRVTLLSRPDGGYTLLWSMHHSITDGWSSSVLVAELAEMYNARKSGVQHSLPPSLPFSGYMQWLSEQDIPSAEAHWQAELVEVEEMTRIAVGDKPAVVVEGKTHDQMTATLPAEIGLALAENARTQAVVTEAFDRSNHTSAGCHGLWTSR